MDSWTRCFLGVEESVSYVVKMRVVSIILAIAMVLTCAIGAGAAETFRVGVVGPRTGPVATVCL